MGFLPGDFGEADMRFLSHVWYLLFLWSRLLISRFAVSDWVAGGALQFCCVSRASVRVALLQPSDTDAVSMGGIGVQSFRVTSTRGLSSGVVLFGCISFSVKACGADTTQSV